MLIILLKTVVGWVVVVGLVRFPFVLGEKQIDFWPLQRFLSSTVVSRSDF